MTEEMMMQGIRRGEVALIHYGVKGMKWGVRKNPDRAANRAIGKLRRLDKSSQKYKQKSEKMKVKSGKRDRQSKKVRNFSKRVFLPGLYLDLVMVSNFLNNSSIRSNKRSEKYDKKSKKRAQQGKQWAKDMNEYLSNQTYNNVAKENIDYAKKWAVSAFDR